MNITFKGFFGKMFLTLLFAGITGTIPGQTGGSIRGAVVDETGQPVVFANVAMRAWPDSSLMQGAITDDQGVFKLFPEKPGTYLLEASFVGYVTAGKTVLVPEGQTIDAGELLLRQDQTVLEEVVIKKRRLKARQFNDKTTYYVNRNMHAASKNGTELMKMVPGVQVDLFNDISLEGSKRIVIQVDGMKRDADYLSQLDSDRIDRIEIRSGGAVQQGADIEGIINVILKKEDKRGVQGHLYTVVPTQSDEVYSFPSASLTYSREKTTWFASYAGGFSYFRIHGKNSRELSSHSRDLEIIRNDHLMQENWSHKMNVGMDYFLNEKHQLRLYGFVSGFSNEQDGRMIIQEKTDLRDSGSHRLYRDETDLNRSAFASLYYKRQFSPTAVWTMEGSFYLLNSQNTLSLSDPVRELLWTSATHPLKNRLEWRTDFRGSLTGKLSFESGAQYLRKEMADQVSPSFSYTDRILAGYLLLKYSNNAFKVNGGLRAEYAHASSTGLPENRTIIFLPQLDASYQLSKKGLLNIAYNKRSIRPDIHQLHPQRTAVDPYATRSGYPGLDPSVIQKWSADYNRLFGENSLSAGMFYRSTGHVMEDLTSLTDSLVLRKEMRNLGDLHQAGLKVSGSLNLTEKVSIHPYLEGYLVQTRGNELAGKAGISDRRRMNFESSLSVAWAMGKDMTLSATLQYNSTITGIQNDYHEGALYLLSLDKVFFDWLSVGITSAIPFSKSFTYQGYDISGKGFSEISEDHIQMSLIPFWLNLKYSFASGKRVRRIERSDAFQEKRVKKGF